VRPWDASSVKVRTARSIHTARAAFYNQPSAILTRCEKEVRHVAKGRNMQKEKKKPKKNKK
jgi:hypothetical protein